MSSHIVREEIGGHTPSGPMANGNTKYGESLLNSCGSSPSFRADINPFVHRLSFSKWDKIQNLVITFTILPIRAILAFSCLVLAWFLAFLSLLGRSKDDEKQPLSGWRNCLRPVVVFWARCMFFAGGFHWVTVRGQRASSAEAPVLVVAPHSSFFDSLPVTFLGLCSVVAKTSAQQVPFFGTLTKFSQPVFVSREDPNSRHNTVAEIRRRAATGGQWPQIIIFPEGTCTNRSCLISFKPGAFIPGVPVQPVCIKYPGKHDTYTWTWCGLGPLKSLYYTLCRLHNRCEIEFLPVYTPSEAEKNDAVLFARNVRVKMARALGVPVSEHSYEDGEVMLRGVEMCLQANHKLVNDSMVLRQAGAKMNESMIESLSETLHQTKSYWYNKTQFARLISSVIPGDSSCHQLFTLYQQTDGVDDVVDVRRCLLDLYMTSKPTSIHRVFQVAFQIYAGSNKNCLNNQQLCDMLSALCQYDVTADGKPQGNTFTFDEVLTIAVNLSKDLAESIKKDQPVSDGNMNSAKCNMLKVGRVKSE